MRGELTKRIGELLMDVDDAPKDVLENAPSGHFAAYITPDEAEMLRAQGGGVAPGGGQYMVGGIPTYWGPGDSGEGDPGGVGTGPGTGADAGGGGGDSEGMGFDDPSDIGLASIESADPAPSSTAADAADAPDIGEIDAAEAQAAANAAADAAANEAAAEGLVTATENNLGLGLTSGRSLVTPRPMSRFNVNVTSKTEALNAYFDQAFNQVTNTSIPNQQTQEENQATLQDFVELGWLTNEQAVSIYGRNISEGGTGSMSPGGFAASGGSENTATLDDVVSLNQMDPVTDDYSINVVAPQTEEQVNRAIASSRTFGMLNPTVTNLAFAVGSFLPGVGPVATIGGLNEDRGALGLVDQAFPDLGPAISGFVDQNLPDFGLPNFGRGLFDSVAEEGRSFMDSIAGDPPSFDEGGEGFDSGAAPETPVLPDMPTVADEPTVPELEEMPPFVLLPALGQNQPPERQEPSGPFVEPSPVNLPPVFTEEDARRLLQSSGQLPFAGIV
tara:strand:+ start:1473 stop:2975 length:1503 start_codon:yes stop_codon:yes gene_type:complete